MTLDSSLDLGGTLSPVGIQATHIRMATAVSWPLRLYPSLRLLPRFQASVWAQMATRVTEFNADPSYSWATDLDMVLGSNLA